MAALNATQLARKRANDREAQRAIRQRTKEHIESLERRIAELSEGNDSDKELDDVRRRNYELEEEIRYLKETIALPGDDISESNTAYFACKSYSTRVLLATERLLHPTILRDVRNRRRYLSSQNTQKNLIWDGPLNIVNKMSEVSLIY